MTCNETYESNKLKNIINSEDGIYYNNNPYFVRVNELLDEFKSSSILNSGDYDKELLIQNTQSINSYITYTRASLGDNYFQQIYPNLFERLNNLGFITSSELYSFMKLNSIEFMNIVINEKTLINLNSYYGPSSFNGSGMSSFCSLVPNIFNTIKDAFNDILYFSGKLENLYNTISNLSLSSLLKSLENQFLNVIDKIVESMKAKLNMMSSAFIKDKSSYKYNKDNIYSKYINEFDKMNNILSESVTNDTKAKLKGELGFAASLFEKLNIEEIEFLILRFCELISNLENLYDSFLNPLRNLSSNYNNAYDILKGSGSLRTAKAVASGALRYDEPTLSSGYSSIENITNDGTIAQDGAAMRQRSSRIMPISSEEAEEAKTHLSYDAVTNGTSSYVFYQPGPQSASSGRFGWDNVRPLEKIMLMRLAKSLSVKLYINSAWRSLSTQAEIRKGNESNIPKSGYHQSGQAFDVSRKTISDQNIFINTARGIGFGGIGRYDTFIHIDSRANDVTFR